MTNIIPRTSVSPRLTLKDVEQIAATSGPTHARDIVDMCATQVGSDKCAAAYALLDKLDRE